jgi:hypothetical protein
MRVWSTLAAACVVQRDTGRAFSGQPHRRRRGVCAASVSHPPFRRPRSEEHGSEARTPAIAGLYVR